MIISNYFIKRKIDKLVRSTNRKRCFKDLNEVKRILVLYNKADANEAENCIRILEGMGKTVFACGESGKLTYWGFPQNSALEPLNDFSPDMLLDLTSSKYYAMQYLSLRCDCDFKVGIQNGKATQYDFAVTVTVHTDINYLFKQIIFYLQTIRSK